jgi:hypothetical protein
MLAPVVTSTGAAQVAEPMIVAEAEKKSAEKRSHDNLSDPEIDAAAKRGTVGGAVAQVQHQILAPAPAQEIFPVPPDAGVEQRTEPSVIIGIPSTQRSLFDELQSIDMSSSAIPHPPQQLLQLHGAAGLSGPVAPGADAQADGSLSPLGQSLCRRSAARLGRSQRPAVSAATALTRNRRGGVVAA